VTVNKGWLTLEGQVSWQFERSTAESGLRHLIGVTGITNNITLKPIAQASAVKQRIEEALKRNAEIEAKQIRVEIKDGRTVTLEGRVDNWSERTAVERAVWSAPGVSSVIDNLTIG
jgi:osmotically-inducible protein OsmY